MRAYLLAFFGTRLLNQEHGFLHRPSADYPQVTVERFLESAR